MLDTRTGSEHFRCHACVLAERVVDVKGLLGMRLILRKLIPGAIICTPFDDTRRGRGYAISATGTYAGLLGGKPVGKYDGGEGGI